MTAALQELPELLLHRFNRRDYHAMADSGILREGDRVELIEGSITTMMPVGVWHVASGGRLQEALYDRYGKSAHVYSGAAVALGDFSEPQPDIVVLRRRDDFYLERLAGPEDVLLLIEISDSSRNIDLVRKRDLYAAHGIREYWVVDGQRQCVHVFRNPERGAYVNSRVYSPGEDLPLPECEGKTLPAMETGIAFPA